MNKKILFSFLLFGLLVLGIFAGVSLVQQRQIFFSRAAGECCGSNADCSNEEEFCQIPNSDCGSGRSCGRTPDPTPSCPDDVHYWDSNANSCIHKHGGRWAEDVGCVYAFDREGCEGCNHCDAPPPTPSCPDDVHYWDSNANSCIHKHGGVFRDGQCVYAFDREGCEGCNHCGGTPIPTRPVTPPVSPTTPAGSTTTCLGQRTWADIYDGLRRADYNGPWDQTSALSAFNRTSCPTCTNAGVTSRLSPPLAESCLTCIKNQNPNQANIIKNMNPDLFTGCNDNEIITFWCNGGVSPQGADTCNSVKNGQCASSCGGGPTSGPTPTPTSNTAFYRISKTPFADETTGWESYTGEPTLVSLDFPEATVGQDLNVFAQFKSTNGTLSDSFTKTIKYIGEGPRITSLSCSYSPTGDGTEVRILGENFGDQGTNSKVSFNNVSAQILSWANIVPTSTPMPALTETPTPEATATITPTPTRIPPNVPLDSTGSGVLGVTNSSTIVAKINERLQENQAIPVYLETNEGRRAPGTAQLYCTIKVVSISFNTLPQCRPPQNFGNTNVRVQIYEDTQTPGVRPVYDQKITLNADGTPVWVAPPLEVGKNYVLVIKGPQGLGYEKKFTATAGTIALPDLSLPVGDIAPLSNPDNVINSADYSELKREWNAVSDVTRAGDFNLDNRVNSVDYSCMRVNFNNNGAKFLTGQ